MKEEEAGGVRWVRWVGIMPNRGEAVAVGLGDVAV